jgi:hypothetical protein
MGVAKATDNVATCLCVTGAGVVLLSMAIVAELVTCPVTIPIRISRKRRYNKDIEAAVKSMSSEQVLALRKELEVAAEKEITYSDFQKYVTNLKKVKYHGLNDVKFNLIPATFSKNVLCNKCPPSEQVVSQIALFANEVLRQSHMTKEDIDTESFQRVMSRRL